MINIAVNQMNYKYWSDSTQASLLREVSKSVILVWQLKKIFSMKAIILVYPLFAIFHSQTCVTGETKIKLEL